MRETLSRREFGALSGVLLALPCIAGGCSREEDILALTSLIDTLAKEPGVKVLSSAETRRARTLPRFAAHLRALGPSRWFWEPSMPFSELLSFVVDDEFRRGRIVNRHGWVMTETEAELYALAAAQVAGGDSEAGSDEDPAGKLLEDSEADEGDD